MFAGRAAAIAAAVVIAQSAFAGHGEGRGDRGRGWGGWRHEEPPSSCEPAREARCVTELRTSLRIDGERVRAIVRVWEECGEIKSRVTLTARDGCVLREVVGVEVHVTSGRRTACLEFCRERSGRRELVFASGGECWSGGECATVSLSVQTACGTRSVEWRGVEIG